MGAALVARLSRKKLHETEKNILCRLCRVKVSLEEGGGRPNRSVSWPLRTVKAQWKSSVAQQRRWLS